MDVQQYNNPAEYDPALAESGALVRLVIKISGGSIRTVRQANIVLFCVIVLALLGAYLLFSRSTRNTRAVPFNKEDARKQLEEYKKIQPF